MQRRGIGFDPARRNARVGRSEKREEMIFVRKKPIDIGMRLRLHVWMVRRRRGAARKKQKTKNGALQNPIAFTMSRFGLWPSNSA